MNKCGIRSSLFGVNMFSIKHGLIIFSLVALSACETTSLTAPQSPDSAVTFSTSFTIDSLIGSTRDTNGYWHLTLNRGSLQTTARVHGTVSWNGPAVNVTLAQSEAISVDWESNLSWIISNPIGYIVRRPCLAAPNVTCVYVVNGGVVLDTVSIDYFAGMEVPTTNVHSYSDAMGAVNNMIAPINKMVGDTMVLTGHAMFRWETCANGHAICETGRVISHTIEIIRQIKVILE